MNREDDLTKALDPVAQAFDRLGINFYVGGSVASSFHGAMRSTMDVDVVADLVEADVAPLLGELANEYYASEPAIRAAVQRRGSFNLIHFTTSFKVDVFAHRRRPFDKAAFARAKPGQIGSDPNFTAPIASAEDTILSKLEWYRLGNETSERQWKDVTSVLALLGDQADINHLRQFAEDVGVSDLLERLLAEHRG